MSQEAVLAGVIERAIKTSVGPVVGQSSSTCMVDERGEPVDLMSNSAGEVTDREVTQIQGCAHVEHNGVPATPGMPAKWSGNVVIEQDLPPRGRGGARPRGRCTSAATDTGRAPAAITSIATPPPREPPATPIGPSEIPSCERTAATAAGASSAACDRIGPNKFNTGSARPSLIISSDPPAGNRRPVMGSPRYSRHAGSAAIGSAAAIAESVRGGSRRCQITTSGAGARSSGGGRAVNGTPAAVPVIGWLDEEVIGSCKQPRPAHGVQGSRHW